jgi:hypothetical protein
MAGSTATSTRPASKTTRAAHARFRSAAELREVLDAGLAAVDADEHSGPLVRAANLRLRLACPDLGVTVNVAAAQDPDHHLEWSFSDSGAVKPKLELKMDSEIANGWLQGMVSVPIAIARGEINVSGDARCALLYLPAAKLFIDPYRRLLRERYPHLLLD